MKFVLFVEGHTERKAARGFLHRCINEQLDLPKKVGLTAVQFEGWPQLHNNVEKRARMYLDGPGSEDVIAVISLLDLYGPTFYPEHVEGVEGRNRWGSDYIRQKVQHARFRHYFAVHETEAWLLSSPDIFNPKVRDAIGGINRPPEAINNREPPAKRLDQIYRSKTGRSYDKVTDGQVLFRKLKPKDALAACPHLKQMVDEMVAMAREFQTQRHETTWQQR